MFHTLSFPNKMTMVHYTQFGKTKSYLAFSFHLNVSQFKITTASLQDGGQRASHLLAFMPLYHLLPHQKVLTCVIRFEKTKWDFWGQVIKDPGTTSLFSLGSFNLEEASCYITRTLKAGLWGSTHRKEQKPPAYSSQCGCACCTESSPQMTAAASADILIAASW